MIAINRQHDSATASPSQWQAHFLALLPQIRDIASHACRGKDRQRREEFIAEVVANAYVAFMRLVRRGRLDIVYPTPLAKFAVRQVRAGRRVGSRTNVQDVSSPSCQRVKGVTLERLERRDEARGRWRQVLIEDKRSTPADIAAWRLDFAAWLRSLSRKKRRVAKTLATGETTGAAARKHRLSPGRISQIRHELHEAWRAFQGEAVPA